MMRYNVKKIQKRSKAVMIMNDEYISRTELVEALLEIFKVAKMPRDVAEAIASSIPSADVVEVIRCKDCKYYVPTSERIGECKDTRMNSTYMNYCGYAERKTNDE